MREFNQVHMDHIKEIFTERTGVSLPRRRRRRLGTVALLAAALALCLGATVAAASLFSSLEEDQLSLTAVYQGDGVVTVEVENRSDKALRFQPVLRLTRWRTGEAAAALGGIYAVLALLPGWSLLGSAAGKCLMALGMVLIVFGRRGYFLRHYLLFLAVSCTLSGAVVGVEAIIRTQATVLAEVGAQVDM